MTHATGNPDRGARRTAISPAFIRLAAIVIAAAAMLLADGPPAHAQVVALVNGEPITAHDVAQRIRLIELSARKKVSNKEALDELIDDKLKIQVSKRFITEVPKREIDAALNGIARRAGLTTQQFATMLQSSGLTVESMRSRIHADFVWQQIVRGKFQGSLQVGEKDVALAMAAKNKTDDTAGYEYRLRPVVFLVPRGSSPAVYEARKRDAEGLRNRFQSCEEGLRMATALTDVAIRDQMIRLSSDLGQVQRDALNVTAVGRLTPPEITQQGVEMFAVCSKEQAKGETPGRRELRDEIYRERFEAQSKRYIRELRRGAMIEIR
jgi:peptidyl-prolyl cis-trans isomerase SurA